MATFNSPIKAAEHVSFVKRYLNANLFQVSLLLEAKTLAALSLGRRKVRWKKRENIYKKRKKKCSLFLYFITDIPGIAFPFFKMLETEFVVGF